MVAVVAGVVGVADLVVLLVAVAVLTAMSVMVAVVVVVVTCWIQELENLCMVSLKFSGLAVSSEVPSRSEKS